MRPIDELRRTARILEILSLVAASPKQHLPQDLADRFGIDLAVLEGDVEAIRNRLKLPLQLDSAGFFLASLPSLPTLQYNFSEALALLTAVQAAQQVSGVSSPELNAAITNLEALFPEEVTELLRRANRPPDQTVQRQHRQQMMLLLNRALIQQRKVQITYETASRAGQISQRVVRPYSLMPYVRSWQLIAYCEKRQAPLMFKLDRIHEATLLDAIYQIPDDFDIDEYMGGAWGAMRGNAANTEPIVLQFSPDAARWVAEEAWHSSQEIEYLDDSSILFRLEIAITPEFINWILYYGSRVEVLEPEHLRQEILAEHGRATALYYGTN